MKLYVLNDSAAYSPPTIQGTWDDSASVLTKAMAPVVPAYQPFNIKGVDESSAVSPFRVAVLRAVSPPLAAQTISGWINVLMAVCINGGFFSDNHSWAIHVYVTQGDTDTPRGTLLANYDDSTSHRWLPNTVPNGKALEAVQTMSSLAVQAGDRIVAELGYVARDTNGVTLTGNIAYGGSLADLVALQWWSEGNGFIEFENELEFEETDFEVTSGLIEFLHPSGGEETWITSAMIEYLRPATAPAADDLCNTTEEPIVFCSVSSEGDRDWFAVVDLPDSESYYGGWKEDRLLDVSDVRRSLSGPNSDYQVGTFSVELADEDYAIRTLLTANPSKFYSRLEIESYLITPFGRENGLEPLLIATGQVDSDPEFDTRDRAMTVRFQCRDRIGIAMGWTDAGQSKLPRRILNQTTLPGVIPAMTGKGAPIPFGLLNREGVSTSGVSVPVLAQYPLKGAYFFDHGVFSGGPGVPAVTPAFAPWNSDISSPVSVSANAVAGGEVAVNGPDFRNEGRYHVQVFPRKAGRVGNPFPFCAEDLFVTVTSGNQQIDVSWTPGGSNVDDYVAILMYHEGFELHRIWAIQYLIVTGTSCSFTKSPPDWWPAAYQPSDLSLYTPGAQIDLGDVQRIGIWRIRSKNNSVRSAWSERYVAGGTTLRFPWNGSIRPLRFYFEPTGAPQYELGLFTATSIELIPTYIFTGPDSQIEDGLNYLDYDHDLSKGVAYDPKTQERPSGRVRGLYVRDVTTASGVMGEVLIAGVPIRGVDTCYFDPGGDTDPSAIEVNPDNENILYPKTGTAWDSIFPTLYRDIRGADGVDRRYTMAYVRDERHRLLASGIATISFDLQGVEATGDSTGEVITDLHDQAYHLLTQFVCVSGEGYTAGGWLSPLLQGFRETPIVDPESFEALKVMRAAELTGGLVGAGVVGAYGDVVDVSAELKRWCVSGDFRLGPNRDWQIVAKAIDENLNPLFITNMLTDENDIHNRTFKPQPRLAELQNVFLYRFQRDYMHASPGWLVDGQNFINQESLDSWKVRKQGEDLAFYYLDDPACVDLIFRRHVSRRANAPVYVALEAGLCQLSADYDLGAYFRLKHWRGIQNGGWEDRIMWVLSNTFSPKTKRARLECLDVTDLLGEARVNALLEGLMDIALGGSFYHSPTISGDVAVVEAYDYWDKRFPWSDFPAGTTLQARIWGAVPSGASMTAHLFDPDANTVVATDPTSFTSTAFELHTFLLPTSDADRQYRLRATISGAHDGWIGLKGMLRPNLP